MNFDNPEVYSDTSIFDGLVYICKCWCPHIHVTGVPEGLAQAFKTFGDSRVAATIPAPGL